MTKEQCYVLGDWRQGMVSMSAAGRLADAIEPSGAIVERFIRDAVTAFDAAQSIRQP